MLALRFSHARRHVCLNNIFLPQTLRRGGGIGKAVIDANQAAAGADGYSLFATGLVPNFYERLVGRGAVIVTVDDAVLITPETDLTNHYQ